MTAIHMNESVLVKAVDYRTDKPIGMLVIPATKYAELEDNKCARFIFSEPRVAANYFNSEMPAIGPSVRYCVVEWSHHTRGAVHILGMTPAEFEAVPGCAFIPGAAWLEGKIAS